MTGKIRTALAAAILALAAVSAATGETIVGPAHAGLTFNFLD